MFAKSKLLAHLLLFSALLLGCNPTEEEQTEINTALVEQGCDIPPSFDGYSCKGKFVARSIEDLNSYLGDYGLKNGFVKHLKIDFNFSAPSVQITSPCSITIRDEAVVSSTSGSLCLVSKGRVFAKGMNLSATGGNITLTSFEDNVIMDDGSTITTQNLNMMAYGKAVIQNTATINAHDINMKSFGEDKDARVHIRHSSNVTANNIFLEAKRKATLGRDSVYNVAGTIRIIGEGPDDDADNPEFATIWKNTTVNTNELIIDSTSKTKISGGITVNANKIKMAGPACKIGKNAVLNAPVKEGNCFSGDHPTAKNNVPKSLRTGEAPYTVTFDASKSSDNAGIVSYEWKVGELDLLTTTEPNLTYTFNDPGVYKVRLKVTDTSGLVDYATRKITVTEPTNNGPQASFTLSKSLINTNEEFVIDASGSQAGSSPIVSYIYSFGDGNSQALASDSTTYSYPNSGSYTVSVLVTDSDGLSSSASQVIQVNAAPISNIIASTVNGSAPLSVNFDGSNSFDSDGIITDYSWDFSDGTNAIGVTTTKVFNDPGSYVARLNVTDNNGAVSFSEITINVVDGQSPQPPIAQFNLAINNLAVDVDASGSFDPNSSIISYKWNWGDGNTDVSSNPVASHTYSSEGNYIITLSIESGDGERANLSRSIFVEDPSLLPAPDYNFAVDTINDLKFNFNAGLSTFSQNANRIVSYSWNWGDSSEIVSSSSFEASHIYAGAGNYPVTLTIEDDLGKISTITKNVVVSEPVAPQAILSINKLIANPDELLSFDASSSTAGSSPIVSYRFEFGDAFSLDGSDSVVSHSYLFPTNYNVKLIVTGGNGLTSETTQSLRVNAPPVIDFDYDELSGISPFTLSLEAFDSFDPDGSITTYQWEFSDGTTAEGVEISKTFTEPGRYTAKLILTDNDGLISNPESLKKDTIEFLVLPSNLEDDAFFSYVKEEESNVLNLYYYELIPADQVLSAEYIINNEIFIPIVHFNHREKTVLEDLEQGYNEISLHVVDTLGEEHFFTHQVLVGTDEEVRATGAYLDFDLDQVGPSKILLDFRKSFTKIISENDFDFQSIDWGDGSPEEEVDGDLASTAFHQYSSPGTYSVTFTAVGEDASDVIITKDIIVTDDIIDEEPPIADFRIEFGEGVPYLTFNANLSVSPTNSIASLVWDHGDGTIFTGLDPVHNHFYTPGVYIATLTVTDQFGMQSSLSQRIIVEDEGSPIVSIVDCEQDDDNLVVCEATASDSFDQLTELVIDWGDGNNDSIFPSGQEFINGELEHVYDAAGTYNISFTAKTLRGDENTKTISFVVTGSGRTQPFALASCDDTENEKEIICNSFSSYDPNGSIVSVEYDFGDGTIITRDELGEVTHQYGEGENFEFKMTVTDDSGEKDTFVDRFLYPEPVNVFALSCSQNDDLLEVTCQSLNGPEYPNAEFNYDFGDGTIITANSGDSVTHTYDSIGQKTVRLRVLEDSEYIGGDSEDINFQNLSPIASLFCLSVSSRQVYCDASTSLDLDGNIISYRFDYGEGIQDGVDPTFNVVLSSGGFKNISLEVLDNEGAIQREEIEVFVNFNIDPVASFNCQSNFLTLECNSSGTFDIPNGQLTYEWSVDDVIVSNQETLSRSFQTSGIYQVKLKVTDEFGSSNEVVDSFSLVDSLAEAPEVNFTCIKQTNDAVTCSDLSEQGQKLYQWFVNNELQDLDPESNMQDFTFQSDGIYTIKMIATRGSESIESSQTFDLSYSLPLAGFTYRMLDDGNIEVDASESLTNSRHVDNFIFEIEGLDFQFESRNPISIFRFSDLDGKNLKLTVIDEKQNINIIEKSIDLSQENRPPKALILANQPRGRASREFVFSAINSIDHDGSIVSYEWNIDGAILSGEEITFSFPDSGDRLVTLTVVDDQGKQSVQEELISIEDLDIMGMPTSEIEPLDGVGFSFSNYNPIGEPVVKLGDETISILDKIIDGDVIEYQLIIPPINSGEYDLTVEIDGLEVLHKDVTLKDIILPEEPMVSINESFSKIKIASSQIAKNDPTFEEMNELNQDVLDKTLLFLNSIEDETLLRFTAFMVKKSSSQFLNNQINISNSRKFEKANSLISTIADMIFPKAHADITKWPRVSEERLNIFARECDQGIRLGQRKVSRTSRKLNNATLIAALAGFPAAAAVIISTTPNIPAKIVIINANIMLSTIALLNLFHSVTMNVSSYYESYASLVNCVKTVRFPVISETHQVDFDISDVRDSNKIFDSQTEKTIPIITEGFPEKLKILISGLNYNDYSNYLQENDINDWDTHRIFRVIENGKRTLERSIGNNLSFSSRMESLVTDIIDIINDPTATGPLSAWLTVIKEAALEDLKNKMDSFFTSKNFISDPELAAVAVELGGRKVNIKLLDSEDDVNFNYNGKTLSISNRINEVIGLKKTRLEVSWDGSNFQTIRNLKNLFSFRRKGFFSAIRVKGLAAKKEIAFSNGCAGDALRIHPNGGGLRSLGSIVSGKAFIGEKSQVCKNSLIDSGVSINGNAIVQAADLDTSSVRNLSGFVGDIKADGEEKCVICIKGKVHIGRDNSGSISNRVRLSVSSALDSIKILNENPINSSNVLEIEGNTKITTINGSVTIDARDSISLIKDSIISIEESAQSLIGGFSIIEGSNLKNVSINKLPISLGAEQTLFIENSTVMNSVLGVYEGGIGFNKDENILPEIVNSQINNSIVTNSSIQSSSLTGVNSPHSKIVNTKLVSGKSNGFDDFGNNIGVFWSTIQSDDIKNIVSGTIHFTESNVSLSSLSENSSIVARDNENIGFISNAELSLQSSSIDTRDLAVAGKFELSRTGILTDSLELNTIGNVGFFINSNIIADSFKLEGVHNIERLNILNSDEKSTVKLSLIGNSEITALTIEDDFLLEVNSEKAVLDDNHFRKKTELIGSGINLRDSSTEGELKVDSRGKVEIVTLETFSEGSLARIVGSDLTLKGVTIRKNARNSASGENEAVMVLDMKNSKLLNVDLFGTNTFKGSGLKLQNSDLERSKLNIIQVLEDGVKSYSDLNLYKGEINGAPTLGNGLNVDDCKINGYGYVSGTYELTRCKIGSGDNLALMGDGDGPRILGTGKIIDGFIDGNAELENTEVLSNSTVDDEAVLQNAKIENGSLLDENAVMTGGVLNNSRVFGNATVVSGTIVDSFISGNAYINSSKNGKTCDGFEDNIDGDPCF